MNTFQPGKAGLAAVLEAVGVGVIEDAAGDGDGAVIAEVLAGHGLARRQRDIIGQRRNAAEPSALGDLATW